MYIGNPLLQSAFLVDTFSGNNSTTVFTMSVAPANTASVLVAVSGVLQDPSTYSVVGTTLTFTQAPPTGTGNISARYLGIPASGVTTTAYRTVTTFTATASQTTFTPPSYTVGFINVYRNGVLLTPTSDYTASNGTTVVLASGAASGDTVIVESFLVSSVLNAIPNTAASVSQSNLASGVAGTGPAFNYYSSAVQSIANNSNIILTQFDTKVFDTANCFATSNGRFTPNVAGYYFLMAQVGCAGTATQVSIYKNGAQLLGGAPGAVSGFISGVGSGGNPTALLYANGSTDYFSINVVQNSGGAVNAYAGNYFSGLLIRSA